MNAIKPKLEQKDVGYGGMRAIGDAIGKQILELQVTIDSLKAELTQLRESKIEDVAEIYKLKAKIKSMKSSGEPVAWMDFETKKCSVNRRDLADQERIVRMIPLYTHPAGLTDEKIEQVFEEVYKYKANNLNMEFARALLRKAQE